MESRQSVAKPRRKPVQARSRATVDAIIQAATYILTERGWDGLTTNAIAERAGVNIASLYQFFPNKEAVITELQRRHVAATRSGLRRMIPLLAGQATLRQALTLVIETIIAEHRIAPAVHRAIIDELPRTVRWQPDEKNQLLGQLLEALKPFMKNVPDADLAVHILGVATDAIVHNAIAESPQAIENPALLEELVTLFESYLQRPESRDDGEKR